jgi:hypothetical protein
VSGYVNWRTTRDYALEDVKEALSKAQKEKGRPLSLFEMHQAVDSVRVTSSPVEQLPYKKFPRRG